MVLIFEICLQLPYVASVPRRHLCTMHFDHVALQVHFSTKNDEFLFKATMLLARVVFLREMNLLEAALVAWRTIHTREPTNAP